MRAFSLVELSIVLVILGLLTGGILAGQSLIRAAELRSVVSDYQRYTAAIQTFRDKYMALPGDMANATRFWGKDNTNCPGDTGTAATPGTCNGNATGAINFPGEVYRSWQHLALAGLIEGSYSGFVSPAVYATPPVIGTDVPAGRMSRTYWLLASKNQSTASTDFEFAFTDLPLASNNYLIFSRASSVYWAGPSIAVDEAWGLDTKMDDGRPAFGKFRASSWGSSTGCLTSTASDAVYNMTASANCLIGFIL